MKVCYIKKRFSGHSAKVIDIANAILEDYSHQGYDLTLRQLYYQFVSKGLIANADSEYKKLGSIINDARLAGLIDWDHITDRTRNLRKLSHWNSPQEIIQTCAESYRIDKWAQQANYVEVWVEKDALVGILEVACEPLDVPYFSCRGYTSQSEMWGASQRLLQRVNAGKKVTIIHLGDHDPSGVDMSRDIFDRLAMFISHHIGLDWAKKNKKLMEGVDMKSAAWAKVSKKYEVDVHKTLYEHFEVDRIALNIGQVREYEPPPNPAKITDSRATKYVREHGDESWELDALEPAVITELIETRVKGLRNEKLWKKALLTEEFSKNQLSGIVHDWENITSS